MAGNVTMAAHPAGANYALDLAISNPRLEITGNQGTLIADLNYRPFTGTSGPLPSLEAALDVPFATVDLSGQNMTADGDGNMNIKDAPTTGIPAAMTMIGFDAFYDSPVTLDPLTVAFNPTSFAPRLAAEPKVVVSKTAGLEAGDRITVWGTGFDPSAHVGTRPPLSGQPSGVYVIFGRFAANWKPSAGAPSTNRTVLDQKWALPAPSRALLDPAGTGAAYVTVDGYGRFEATLTVGESAAAGNYGVYTYAGSGAVNSTYETSTPVSLAP